jgi:hypothetical protein
LNIEQTIKAGVLALHKGLRPPSPWNSHAA